MDAIWGCLFWYFCFTLWPLRIWSWQNSDIVRRLAICAVGSYSVHCLCEAPWRWQDNSAETCSGCVRDCTHKLQDSAFVGGAQLSCCMYSPSVSFQTWPLLTRLYPKVAQIRLLASPRLVCLIVVTREPFKEFSWRLNILEFYQNMSFRSSLR